MYKDSRMRILAKVIEGIQQLTNDADPAAGSATEACLGRPALGRAPDDALSK